MSRPLRHFVPDRLFFMTSRCIQARFLLRPEPAINRIVASTLAAATQRWPQVKLYGFIACSNHVHGMLSGSAADIAEFCGYLLRCIARRVNLHRGRRGPLWERRYSAEPILDDDAALAKLLYILANPVKDDLVERALHWPGFSTLHEAMGGAAQSFAWRREGAYQRALERDPSADAADFEVLHTLRVEPLPALAELDPAQQAAQLSEALAEVEQNACRRRHANGHRLLTARRVLQMNPEAAPHRPKRSPRPLCHTTIAANFHAYRAEYAAFATAYAEASRAFRNQRFDVRFPVHSFRPPPGVVT